MPRRDKKKRKKNKKTKLSTEEILMLLKKLKPKTSQSVRVNVGDAKGGKSSHTPPYVVPQQPSVTYTFAGQPLSAPTAPPAIPVAPTAAPIVPKKPLERKPRKVVTMATPLSETEIESEIYKLRNPFNTPPQNKTSRLGEYVSSYSRMEPSSQYTQYPTIDLSSPDSDSAGVVSNPISQDEWTGSPDGTSVPFNEMEQQQSQMVSSGGGGPVTPQEAFAGEGEVDFTAIEPSPSTLNEVFISTPDQKRAFIDNYIEMNNRNTPIPKQFLVSIGGRRGTLKQGISKKDLNSIYDLAKQDIIKMNQM